MGARKNFDGPLVADITLFSFYSGWRLREALHLHRDWIKVTERLAVLPKAHSKNKKPRIFPLEGCVWEMVDRRVQSANADGYLFHRSGKPVKSVRKLCKTVCEIAEINPEHFFHNLRRSATTLLNRSGVDKETGKRITGHVTDTLYNRYNQVSVEQLRALQGESGRKTANTIETQPGYPYRA
jgi:integrase